MAKFSQFSCFVSSVLSNRNWNHMAQVAIILATLPPSEPLLLLPKTMDQDEIRQLETKFHFDNLLLNC